MQLRYYSCSQLTCVPLPNNRKFDIHCNQSIMTYASWNKKPHVLTERKYNADTFSLTECDPLLLTWMHFLLDFRPAFSLKIGWLPFAYCHTRKPIERRSYIPFHCYYCNKCLLFLKRDCVIPFFTTILIIRAFTSSIHHFQLFCLPNGMADLKTLGGYLI